MIDFQTVFYAIVGILVAALGIGYLFQSNRANKAENAAHDYEYKEKVEAMKNANAKEPLSDLINDFDNELNDDNKGDRS